MTIPGPGPSLGRSATQYSTMAAIIYALHLPVGSDRGPANIDDKRGKFAKSKVPALLHCGVGSDLQNAGLWGYRGVLLMEEFDDAIQ